MNSIKILVYILNKLNLFTCLPRLKLFRIQCAIGNESAMVVYWIQGCATALILQMTGTSIS